MFVTPNEELKFLFNTQDLYQMLQTPMIRINTIYLRKSYGKKKTDRNMNGKEEINKDNN